MNPGFPLWSALPFPSILILALWRTCDLHFWNTGRGQLVSARSLSRVWLLQPQRLQHARLPCSSPTPRTYSNSCPLHQWCHQTISSFVIPFSSHLQSRPAILGDGFTTESMAIRKWEQEISPTCWHSHPWAHWLALTMSVFMLHVKGVTGSLDHIYMYILKLSTMDPLNKIQKVTCPYRIPYSKLNKLHIFTSVNRTQKKVSYLKTWTI